LDEIGIASRFKREEDRRSFIVNRGILRCLLARYLHTSPARVPISYGRNGKPRLGRGGSNLQFNLSHTRGLSLFAFCRNHALGIDAEFIDPSIDEMRLATWLQAFGMNPPHPDLPRIERLRIVVETWVRMEAVGKAQGICLERMLNGQSSLSEWEVISIDAGREHAAALAVKGVKPALVCWEWVEPNPYLLGSGHE
jgi:4'-phosphopantetheinyl transferase